MSRDAYTYRTGPVRPDMPLIFAFHGTGGDENQFFSLAQDILPQSNVISPRGDVLEHGAARFFRRTAEGVYDMADLATRTEAMVSFVSAHKDAHPGVPVYGFGYSNGANILASTMMAAPDLFDRVGLLHPLIPWEPEPVEALSGKRVLVTAGKRDPICPWPLSQALISWLDAQGADVSTVITEGGHELRPTEIAALVDLFAT